MRQGYFDRSKLSAHVCDEDHQIDWDQTVILQFGPITLYRKYKVATQCSATDKKGIKNSVKCEIRYRLLLDI